MQFWLKGHWEPCNEVGSLSLAEHQWQEITTKDFVIATCNVCELTSDFKEELESKDINKSK